MREKIYLLSLREAKGEGYGVDAGVLVQMLAKLDKERLAKVNRIKSPAKKLESAGGSLLLQLAVQEALAGEWLQTKQKTSHLQKEGPLTQEEPNQKGLWEETDSVYHLTISRLLNAVESPLPLEYIYKGAGKPYFKNYPYFFSLSHSGEYVLCVISDEEIGADIQEMKPCNGEKIAERFFAPKEQERLEQCRGEAEKLSCFYEIWTGKEAYGKMTGEGVGKTLAVNVPEYGGGVAGQMFNQAVRQQAKQYAGQPFRYFIRQLSAPAGYKIAVCVRNS